MLKRLLGSEHGKQFGGGVLHVQDLALAIVRGRVDVDAHQIKVGL